MDKRFTVITPTGDRPEAFDMCREYVERQTVQPSQWIVIDDGEEALNLDLPFYIRRERRNSDPKHTLPLQMIEAFRHIQEDYILIMEDDDWYAPNYCEEVLKLFDRRKAPLMVGQGQTVYFNVKTRRHHIHNNRMHASWNQTAFKKELIRKLSLLCNSCAKRNYPYVDLRSWRTLSLARFLLLDAKPLCIGMKAMPGRRGSVSGHFNSHGKNFTDDLEMTKLKGWIGPDYRRYAKFYEPKILQAS